MKKNCLVVGANSFIGHHLINSLKEKENVIGVYHQSIDKLHDDVSNISLSELNALDEMNYDCVFIISAYIPEHTIDANSRYKMFHSNVALIDTICSKFKKSRIIYCSSVSVYKLNNNVITETAAEGGLNEYGISKLWGEKIVEQQASFSIFRLSSVYGVNMRLNSIIPIYIKQALETKSITVYGKGERLQNYIHISDVVGFLKNASLSSLNDKFLGTAPSEISNLQLAQEIAVHTGATVNFEGNDNSPSFKYNNSYTREQLHYSPQVSISNGIKEVIEWMQRKY